MNDESDLLVQRYLSESVSFAKKAEEAETCTWCRGHVSEYRIYGEELVSIALLSHDMDSSEAVMNLVKKMGESAEAIGALAFMGRVLRQLRRIGVRL